MNPLRLVFAEARKGLWSLLALALLLGLSIGSGVCITSVEKAVRAGAARAGDDFDLIIGAQGSATDLVLSGVYLRENTLKLIPGELSARFGEVKGRPGPRHLLSETAGAAIPWSALLPIW